MGQSIIGYILSVRVQSENRDNAEAWGRTLEGYLYPDLYAQLELNEELFIVFRRYSYDLNHPYFVESIWITSSDLFETLLEWQYEKDSVVSYVAVPRTLLKGNMARQMYHDSR